MWINEDSEYRITRDKDLLLNSRLNCNIIYHFLKDQIIHNAKGYSLDNESKCEVLVCHIISIWQTATSFYPSFIGLSNEISFLDSLHRFWGTLCRFWGTILRFWGTLLSFWGTLLRFWGALLRFWRTLHRFWGNHTFPHLLMQVIIFHSERVWSILCCTLSYIW